MFFMGLTLGLAITVTLTLAVLLGFLWSGKSLGGGSQAVVADNYQKPSQQAPSPEDDQPVAAGPVAPVTDKDHVLGNKNAKVTVVEYSDFECPYCSRHEPTLKQLLQTFPKDVRIVYRHFPLSSIHSHADLAAEASECAFKQGGNDAFWKMHDKLFAQAAGAGLSDTIYPDMAKSIGLDPNKMKTCLDNHETKSVVQAQAASGNDAGVNGTPANFINGKLLSGAQPYSAMEAAVKAAGATQ